MNIINQKPGYSEILFMLMHIAVILFFVFLTNSIFAAGLEGQSAEYGGEALVAGVKEIEKVGWGPLRYASGLIGFFIAMYNAAFTQNIKAIGAGGSVCLAGVVGPSFVKGLYGAIIPF